MKISLLADHPSFIQTLAPWLVEHWRLILPHDTIATRSEKFRTHMNYTSLPIAWVAHDGNNVFGTAALRVHDLPGHEHLTPWLGGVFVAPAYRQQGIGAALCAHVEQVAKNQLVISTLYLFTLDKQEWYGKLGWIRHEPCTWCGLAGDVMVKKI